MSPLPQVHTRQTYSRNSGRSSVTSKKSVSVANQGATSGVVYEWVLDRCSTKRTLVCGKSIVLN
jgi:hypothetical protein